MYSYGILCRVVERGAGFESTLYLLVVRGRRVTRSRAPLTRLSPQGDDIVGLEIRKKKNGLVSLFDPSCVSSDERGDRKSVV